MTVPYSRSPAYRSNYNHGNSTVRGAMVKSELQKLAEKNSAMVADPDFWKKAHAKWVERQLSLTPDQVKVELGLK